MGAKIPWNACKSPKKHRRSVESSEHELTNGGEILGRLNSGMWGVDPWRGINQLHVLSIGGDLEK